jgi:hypothetical protein
VSRERFTEIRSLGVTLIAQVKDVIRVSHSTGLARGLLLKV